MDDLQMLGTLLEKPGPSAEVTARGRNRLHAAATSGPARRRRFTWPAIALSAATAGTAVIMAVSGLSPTATPNGPPAVVSGRQVLLAAATTAEARPAGSGTFWHVKTVQWDSRSSATSESWTRRDGREWQRRESQRLIRVSGSSAFSVAGTVLTFRQIQGLPTDPAALKARITGLLGKKKLPPNITEVGLGHDPRLIQSLVDLLARVPAPPRVRATAFRVLAGLPGVSRAGSVSGGQTLLIRGPWGDARMVVDPATSLVRGLTITAPPRSEHRVAWLADQSISFPTAEWTMVPPK